MCEVATFVPVLLKISLFGYRVACCHNLFICLNSCWIFDGINVQGRELYLGDLKNKNNQPNKKHQTLVTYTCVWILVNGFISNHCVMQDTAKFYSPTIIWMNLNVTQGHRIMRKAELVQSFCCKWHEVAHTFARVDYVRQMSSKKSCNYGKHGLLSICPCCFYFLLLFFF